MATWSSFEKDKLITEGWRDFFKKKDKPAGTYPASELTTIVNLISNLAKKLEIDVDTSKIVDEFEAILKSENYNLQEQEDKIMIGGDVLLDLKKTPNLQAFVKAVAQKSRRGLKILLKALDRGAFKVSGYEPAASTEQTPTEEPKQATSATPVVPEEEPEKETPSRIDLLKPPRSLRDVKGSENYKKFMASLLDFFANQMKIDIKIAKKIVRDIWAKTPTSGKFNKLVFKEQMEKEIDIAAILANSGLNPTQQIKVLGALKKWAAQNSDLIDDRMTKILKLRDDEEQKPQPSSAETEVPTPDAPIEPEAEKPSQAPEVNQEPAPEPQATEEPLKIITKILGGKGVGEEKVNAFINDLRDMGVIREIASRTLKNSLKMNKDEWVEFSKRHEEVIKAINQLGGKSKSAIALQKQFKDALSKIITREKIPSVRRRRTIKKSTASKKEPTPAVASPTEPEPEAASLEPEAPTPDTSAETEPEAASPEPEVSREPESEREDTEPDPTKELESYIEEVKKKIKLYNTSDPDERRNVLPTTTDVIKKFRFKYKNLVREKAKKPFMDADAEFFEQIGYLVNRLDKKHDKNEEKIKFIDYYIKQMENAEDGMTFKNALDIFKKVVEPVKQFLLSQANPEPAGEERGKDETPKPPSKSKEEIPPVKNQEAYEHGKQGKSMTSQGELKDQKVLPSAIDNVIRRLNSNKPSSEDQEKQDLRDKIESYISGLYAFQDENETATKLEESLMLRWKTIAGIK